MYLKQYRNDIAISYAAIDNTSTKTDGWVDNFLKDLRNLLRPQLGIEITIWSQQMIAGYQVPADETITQLQEAATIIVLLSEAYLQDPQSQAELTAILTHVPITSNRLFVVEFTQLTRPPALQALRGYRLWAMNSQQRPRTLGLPDFQSDANKTDYLHQLGDLAHDLSSCLKALRDEALTPSSPLPAMLETAPQSVLLAAVTNDLYMQRETVRRHLEYHGIRVLPLQPYPLTTAMADWQAAFKADLAQSMAFVQLLSDSSEQLAAGLRLPQWQFETVQTLRPEMPILQWRSAQMTVVAVQDAGVSALLQGTEVRVTTLAQFKAEVVQQVRTAPVDAFPRPMQGQTVPYPGLRAFTRDEVGIFFGRKSHVLAVWQGLQRSRLLAVVGLSGYGKSSLVHTGLLPALMAGTLPAMAGQWQVAVMRPGTGVLNALAASLWAVPDFQVAYIVIFLSIYEIYVGCAGAKRKRINTVMADTRQIRLTEHPTYFEKKMTILLGLQWMLRQGRRC